MEELHSYLVAQSIQSSYNMNMNTDTINTITTLVLLLPIIAIPVMLIWDLFVSYNEQQQKLFGPVRQNNK